MKKIFLLFLGSILFSIISKGQDQKDNTIYIVDSVPIIQNPTEEESSLNPSEIADIVVIRNRDSLRMLGYEKMDGAIFIFTVEYKNRPEEVKNIPTTMRMTRQDGKLFLTGSPTPYSGPFIDYFLNGKKQGEGFLKEGKLNGLRTIYYHSGPPSVERQYEDGIENGTEKEYYADGSLSQKGDFRNGKEEGVWEMYYPNGQVKQRNTFEKGKFIGESLTYYSLGRIKARESVVDGHPVPDPAREKIQKLFDKGTDAEKNGDHRQALKNYAKCLEIDTSFAEAYFGIGASKMNDERYDEAILNFDKALSLEPYFKEVLADRAYCRIQKYSSGRRILNNSEVTVMAVGNKKPIPEKEAAMICSDLQKALLLDPGSAMIKNALAGYCHPTGH